MRAIFRIETLYGTHDADTLKRAKETSKPGDHIQLIACDGLTILSRVARKYAYPSWAIRTACKSGHCVYLY